MFVHVRSIYSMADAGAGDACNNIVPKTKRRLIKLLISDYAIVEGTTQESEAR